MRNKRIGMPEKLRYMSDRFLDLVLFAVTQADKLDIPHLS